MNVRWLGWAGVEIEVDGVTVVIDPLSDPGAVFAALGETDGDRSLPSVSAPRPDSAVAALVTHLHRDHADAEALAGALSEGAILHEPPAPSGEDVENLALAQAGWELDRAGLRRKEVAVWERVAAGPFALTALPAVDGLGDPQVSWLVEVGDRRALHLGDTIFHGSWWRMARRHGPFDVVFAPINGAVVDFPHMQPPSPLAAAMEPEQAALAGELLGAATVVPIHYDGLAADPWYRPIGDALERFLAASSGRPFEALVLEPGESLEPGAVAAGRRDRVAERR